MSTLIRLTGDWALAEDCTQDAFEAALARWGREGIPRTPGAWLTTVAKNRAIDRLRRSATEDRKLREAAIMTELDDLRPESLGDDRLRLIFTCCHPALGMEARVALTLRTVAGLTTTEIARAFLVAEPTMAQRLVRATAKIRNAGIPYRVPEGPLRAERLPGVLAVLYLLFTVGYGAVSGDEPERSALAAEAIRVTRVLAALMPGEPEIGGLLALMVLQYARRAGRVDAAGGIVPLEDQDRALWDRAAIAEGLALLSPPDRQPDSYRLQALIAAQHAIAPSFEETDFAEIVRLYDRLAQHVPTSIVALNRAIAVGMADGPQAGLDALESVPAVLEGYYLLAAARADFLRRVGRNAEAAEQYRAAIAAAPVDRERRFLERRLRELRQ